MLADMRAAGTRSFSRMLILGASTFFGTQLLFGGVASAHVKWFTDFDFRDPPLTFGEVISLPFIIGLAIATLVITALPAVDQALDTQPLYAKVNSWLTENRSYADPILRYVLAGSLVLTWSRGVILAPELDEPIAFIGWLQLLIAAVLLTKRFERIAGGGLILLWLIGVFDYGLMHMLDYFAFLGMAAYFILRTSSDVAKRGLGLPALYVTVGGSFMWLGLEKLVYPEWSFSILDARPVLRLGLPPEVFLHLAAFTEIALGFLLIIGLLGRPLALVITGVFITTTIIFGRLEFIGHAPLHAALIVFLLEGAGRTWPAPFAIYDRLSVRMAFAGFSMAGLTLFVALYYTFAANLQFESAVAANGPLPDPVEALDPTPSIESIDLSESPAGEKVTIDLNGWTFTEPLLVGNDASTQDDPNTGYGILAIDGTTVALITGPQSPLFEDVEGASLALTLFTPQGEQLFEDGVPLTIPIELPED